MGQKIVICHWQGSSWNAIEVAHSSLKGHENHDMDIWPPVQDVTEGKNWDQGEAVYLNDCVLAASPEPTPSGTGSPTLPPTGVSAMLWIPAIVIFLLGVMLLRLRYTVGRKHD